MRRLLGQPAAPVDGLRPGEMRRITGQPNETGLTSHKRYRTKDGHDFHSPARSTHDQVPAGASANKGDPLDIGNFAIMLWARAECTTAKAQQAVAPPVAADGAGEPPSHRQEKLRALADRIDYEKLWRRPMMHQDRLTDDQRDRLDAAVNLRRYADLLASGRWLVLPPTDPMQFSASTLDAVCEMAKRDEARKADAAMSAQQGQGGSDAN